MHICAEYLMPLFDSRKRKDTIEKACRVIEYASTQLDFYAIAVSGTSGILGAIVANELGLDLITVRGAQVKAHSKRAAEGVFHEGGYIFFDDLIDTGETVLRVKRAIEATCAEGEYDYDACGTIRLTPDETPSLVAAVLYDAFDKQYIPDYRSHCSRLQAYLTEPLPVFYTEMKLP